MARVTPETSLGRLSLDVAVAPSQKNGIDPTLIGAFDETLRQARRSEPESAVDVAMPARETRRPDEARDSNATSDREPRERDDTHVEEADKANASDGETRSPEEVESNDTNTDTDTDSEVRPDAIAEHAEADEDVAPSDESRDETEADAVVVVAPVVEESAVQASEEGVPKEGQGEQVSSGNRVGEAAEPQISDSHPAEAAATQSTGEPTVDEVIVAAEGTSEAVDVTQEIASEEAEVEVEVEQRTTDTESGKTAGSHDKSDADIMNQSETANATTDLAGTSGEVLPDGETRQKADRRKTSTRGERREATTTHAGSTHGVPTDVSQPTPAEGGAVASQQNIVAASDTVAPPPEVAAVDLGTTHNAPQPTGSGDVVTGIESRSSTTQSQVDAGQGTGKGTEAGVDPAKFVQRVASAFSALGQRNGPVRLKLYPPELGSLRMEITVKNGTLSAKVEAETAAARGLLVDNLPMLRERLAEQGIRVDRFDVGVSDQSQGGPSERPDDGGRSSRHAGSEADSRHNTNETEGDTTERRDERRLHVDGRLDVFI